MKYLKDPIAVKGFTKGKITDGNAGERVPDSVVDCLNMDFYNNKTKRRFPYIELKDLSSNLPADYSIIDWCYKTFFDANNKQQECLIAIAKNFTDTTSKIKIYLSHYYGAEERADNCVIYKRVQITDASRSGRTITFTAANSYTKGDIVHIYDVSGSLSTDINRKNFKIVSRSNSDFSIEADGEGTAITGTAYCNYVGFFEEWTEITEYYENGTDGYTINSGSFYIEDILYNLSSNLPQKSNYQLNPYKGFSVFNSDSGIIGIVNKSKKLTSGGYYLQNPVYPAFPLHTGWGTYYGTYSGSTFTGYVYFLVYLMEKTDNLDGTYTINFHWQKMTAEPPGGTIISQGNFYVNEEYPAGEAFDIDAVVADGIHLKIQGAFNDFSENDDIGIRCYKATSDMVFLEYSGAPANNTIGICRFPINYTNRYSWKNITNVDINPDIADVIRIYCGDESTSLWLGFLKSREHFKAYEILSPEYQEAKFNVYKIENYGANIKVYYTLDKINNYNYSFQSGQYVTFNNITGDYADVLNGQYKQVISAGQNGFPEPPSDNWWVEISGTQHGTKTLTGKIMLSGSSSYPKFSGYINSVTGLYNGAEPIEYYVRCVSIGLGSVSAEFYWTKSNDFIWRKLTDISLAEMQAGKVISLDSGLSVELKHANLTDFNKYMDVAKISVIKSSYSYLNILWNGFYFDSDSKSIKDRKNYNFNNATTSEEFITIKDISEELGISYQVTKQYESSLSKSDRIYGLCIELDGSQTFFIKHCYSKERRLLNIYAYLEKWFNRRITSMLLFYSEHDELTIKKKILPETKLCDESIPGIIPLSTSNVTMDSTVNGLWKKYKLAIIDDAMSSTSGLPLSAVAATGSNLRSYLNQEYYSPVICRAKGSVSVEKNIIAYGLSQEIINENMNNLGISEKINTGKCSIVISQYQQGAVECQSIMCSERIQEITGDEIMRVAALPENNILIFTKKECHWFKITDFSKSDGAMQSLGEFYNAGLTNPKALSIASFTETSQMGSAPWEVGARDFSGLYWASYENIHGFMKNKKFDLLDNIRSEEYKALSTEIKESIISGYFPDKKEVWFLINNMIWILNIHTGAWRDYEFNDIPEKFMYNNLGMITFNSGNYIYKMTNEKENLYLDKNTDGIPFFLKFVRNHKNSIYKKIPDRFEFNWEHSPVLLGGDPAECKVRMIIYKRNTSTIILEKIFNCNSGYIKAFKNGNIRIAMDYYTVVLTSDLGSGTGDEANFKKFQFNEITTTAVIVPKRQIGKD